MSKNYRVTPKNKKWIVQRVSDRSTVKIPGSPFSSETDAKKELIKLLVSEEKNNTPGKAITFVEAFKNFAEWKLCQYRVEGRVDYHSLQRYTTEYNLRISKYMNKEVLLSDFGIIHMEDYLDRCQAAGVTFKTMRNSVKDIKHFIRRANAVDYKPNLSMLTYNILDNLSVVPQDDDLLYRKEIDVNILDEKKVAEIMEDLYLGMKAKDFNATNTFAIFCMLFFFGLRASELSGIRKDFFQNISCVDIENNLLHIRGVWRNGKYINKTKNRGSKRSIPIDPDATKFLDMWLYYRLEYKPHNKYLLPGKNDGPLCYKYINAQIWKTFAKHDLADITIRRDGHVVVNSSPLKGFPTKIFRHRFSSHLIDAMNKNPLLDRNRVKHLIGHTKFSTSEDVYGNKMIQGSEEERDALAKAKGVANKSSIFSKVIKK